ncbi:MAG: carboxypeptidase regulatory-like domain-containing protein, partial [Bradymonadaceae bacterium]
RAVREVRRRPDRHGELDPFALGPDAVGPDRGVDEGRRGEAAVGREDGRDVAAVVLGRGGTVTGRILSARNDKPLAGATVSVFDMTSPFKPRKTQTGKRGKFRLEKVPAGRRSLRIAHKGHLTRVLSGLQIPEGGTVSREVTLRVKKKGQEFGFRGIGASLRKTDKGAEIINIIPGGGAEKQGLKRGDVIHTVDGRSVRDMPLPKIVQKIRGQAGEPVQLTVGREGRGRFDVEITRGRVVVEGRN